MEKGHSVIYPTNNLFIPDEALSLICFVFNNFSVTASRCYLLKLQFSPAYPSKLIEQLPGLRFSTRLFPKNCYSRLYGRIAPSQPRDGDV